MPGRLMEAPVEAPGGHFGGNFGWNASENGKSFKQAQRLNSLACVFECFLPHVVDVDVILMK